MERKCEELKADIASGTVDETKAVGKKMKNLKLCYQDRVNMDIAIEFRLAVKCLEMYIGSLYELAHCHMQCLIVCLYHNAFSS